jgi:hypothetical protein
VTTAGKAPKYNWTIPALQMIAREEGYCNFLWLFFDFTNKSNRFASDLELFTKVSCPKFFALDPVEESFLWCMILSSTFSSQANSNKVENKLHVQRCALFQKRKTISSAFFFFLLQIEREGKKKEKREERLV